MNLDKYKGHYAGEWKIVTRKQIFISATEHNEFCRVIQTMKDGFSIGSAKDNAMLIADAPIILAEAKRLASDNEALRAMVQSMKCCWNCANRHRAPCSCSGWDKWEPIK